MRKSVLCVCAGSVAALTLSPAWGQQPGIPHAGSETMVVTATRVPEDVELVPASITVISGDELRARGARDLGSALAVVAGVSIAPGGDGGPASSVPELWGLREFDAFLLVVDGVPYGGAFNPALSTLDLTDVDHIEVLRGAAPVMYGATSFVGVINVFHRQAGDREGSARVSGGSYSSGDLEYAAPLASAGSWQQRIVAGAQRQGFKDDRTDFTRGHVLYRGRQATASGTFHLDVSGIWQRQHPASPSPRAGAALSPLVPVDSNQNPRGSQIEDTRIDVTAGYERDLGDGVWSTTLSVGHTDRSTGRGFLVDLTDIDPNAVGFRQDLALVDVYFDTHVALTLTPEVQLVAGVDHLYGSARQRSADFDYFASLDGSVVPRIDEIPAQGRQHLEDTRNFSGLYAQLEWSPAPRWRLQLGARLNHTRESLDAEATELDTGEGEGGSDRRTVTRGSGVAGVSLLALQTREGGVWVYADYRNTFKPAAQDFGPDVEGEVLSPETSHSVEVGLKGRHGDGLLDWELSVFQMDFDNLVVSQITDNGLPGLVNAGKERFKGVELEVDGRLARDLVWRADYAWHSARFTDYERLFDGVPLRIDGNYLEMTPRHSGGLALLLAPRRGVTASLLVERVGERYLNARNTAEADAYTTWSAGVGYRAEGWEVRLDGSNLGDSRAPVAESELGDAQYYRLPARSFTLSLIRRL